ncbi:MAG: universal stress protein, partial [Ignavibacteriaceae bacterium]|nr:universal stress protein [Ignavibacteriaceae bacterium]
ALLAETKRLIELFNAELVLIHVGEKKEETEKLLSETVSAAGLNNASTKIIWATGEPAEAIIRTSSNEGVDLLIAGALEKESFIKYYVGSVARKIMREAKSSVLIFKSPSEKPKSIKSFYVPTDYSSESERTILKAYNFALLEQADEFVLLRDFYAPGLVLAVQETGSLTELSNMREQWRIEEETKMKIFISELNLKGVPIKIHCIYGKTGWEAANYAKVNDADLFAVTPPHKRWGLLDKIFPYDQEHVIKELPANLLIVR